MCSLFYKNMLYMFENQWKYKISLVVIQGKLKIMFF